MKEKPKVPVNENRGKAKLKRNKGLLAMGELTPAAWCQAYDPLFKVKGKKRTAMMKKIK